MTFPRWRQSLARSLHLSRSQAHAKFFQVANAYYPQLSLINNDVDVSQLVIENRTMVHRGFLENTHTILAITDSRSDKICQWQQSAKANICWYFIKSREQYRISARVALIGEKGFIYLADKQKELSANVADPLAVRAMLWSNLSEKAKAQFYWPKPKQGLEDADNHAHRVRNNDIPSTFTAVCFEPYYVDYLNLTSEPQTREVHDIVDSKWSYVAVNP